LIGKSQWCIGAAALTAAIQLHALMYNWTRVVQLANTPPLQSTTPGFHHVSIHQTSPPVRGSKHPIIAYYSIYRPRKDERLSWPSWLTCIGRCTHISGHPSAAGRAQDRESSPAEDRRSTTVPRHQHHMSVRELVDHGTPWPPICTWEIFQSTDNRRRAQVYELWIPYTLAAPTLWNSLPVDITNCPSLTVFRNRLKTFLFHHTFSSCPAD